MRLASRVTLGLLLCVIPSVLCAETLSVRPSLELSERYDSNVLNAPHHQEKSDFVTRLTPKLSAALFTLGTKVSLAGGFDAEYFSDHNELNRSGMTKNVDLSSAEPLRVTSQLSLRPTARYIESRDAVRRNALTQSVVPGLAPAETQVTARTGTRDYSGSLNGTYAATANFDLGLGIAAARKSYFDGGPSLIGSNNYSSDGSASYKLSPNLSTGVYGSANYDEFDNKVDTRVFSTGLSGRYRFTESSTLEVRAGMTFIRSDDLPSRLRKPSGRIEYSEKIRDFTASLRGSIDYATGSFGSETKREDITLRLSDRFAADWSWDTSGAWQTNRSLAVPIREDLMSVQWSAGLHYQVAEYARLNLTGELFRQWNNGAIGTDLYRESALLGFDIASNFPVF
ncbi:MAG TPA: hypothetical protein VGK27_11730 [Candidatus Deferrimicrobiaceae bacterium]|jgi:hypothetical protein